MRSIQTKFIALIASCVILSSVVIGGAGIWNAQKVIDSDSAQMMNLQCSDKCGELDALFSRIEQSVKTLSVYAQEQLESVDRLREDDAYVEEYTGRMEAVALNAAENTEGALAVYVRFNPELAPPTSGLFWSRTAQSGRFRQLTPTDFSIYSPTDTEHVGWYYIPVENGTAIWMLPYLNQNLGVEIISYVIPIYRDDETVGVVGMDIDFSIVKEMVDATRIYDSGYAFLTDAEGNVMHHREIALGTPMETVDKSLAAVVAEMENGDSGSALFSYDGEKKAMAFRNLRNGMRLAVTAPVNEINAARNRLILQTSVAMVLIVALSITLTVVFTRRLIRPLKELNMAAKRIAEGDLTVTIRNQSKDEVGMLSSSFQRTVEHLQKYISHINGLAYRDPLTGVKNKTAYLETESHIEKRMRAGHPEFAVVMLDLNGLKQVNDSYGHDFGDMLIIDACKIICKTFSRSPVYRIGGDEFVVILENGDYEHRAELLDRLDVEIKAHNRRSGPHSQISVARGIAVYDRETDLVFADVFKRADEAMYQKKALMKKREQQVLQTDE